MVPIEIYFDDAFSDKENKKKYKDETREDKKERYIIKKHKRKNPEQMIRYNCRHKVAVRRTRVGGRFIKEINSNLNMSIDSKNLRKLSL